jgi:predicted amidohydrolase YtcJ
MTKAVLAACAILCLLACARRDKADLVVRGAHLHTMTDDTTATAVAVRGDRIVYVGDDAGVEKLVGDDTRVIDVAGFSVTSGLVDAHGHIDNLGRILGEPNLIGTASIDEVVQMVERYQRGTDEGEWIHGRGWDQNDWEGAHEFPTYRDLESTNRNPVYLDRVDGHALWVNRRAMEIAGITRATPDPPGGQIVRDPRGEPTGIFVDNAEELITRHVGAPSPGVVERRIAAALAECNRVGLTGVHDAGTSRAVLGALRALGERGALTVNVYSIIDSYEGALARECLAAGPRSEFDGRLVIRSLKLRADGALGSRGAALLEPYDDDPGNVGLDVQAADTILAWTRAALEAGFQVGTHAIGDRGNHVTLDAYEKALAGRTDARLRIEHCQVLAVEDIPRFKALGVIASMQPAHATSDMPWAERRVGHERLRGAYAWRSLLDSGAVLAFGSDFPVESVNPMTGIYAAVTRQDANGHPDGGWRAHERVSLDEALRGFTAGAAFAAFDEADAGRIAVGMRADLTVLDRNLSRVPAREILDAQVEYTIVRGRIVYERTRGVNLGEPRVLPAGGQSAQH